MYQDAILELSRQQQLGPLSRWMSQQLDSKIEAGWFLLIEAGLG